MIITVFGGSQPKKGDQAYNNAVKLGSMLAENGFTVMTGGYIGTMEAISYGASQVGGHVIGVTCDEIESWRSVGPNAWVAEERRYSKLRDRLYVLIDDCHAAIALPGGIGTIAEVSVMWSQMQTGASARKPLILLGSGWREILQMIYQQMDRYISSRDRTMLTLVDDNQSAIDNLKQVLFQER